MTPDEIKTVLDLHKKWLNGEDDGLKANLREANLRGANLKYADLREANLREADLREANLLGADLLEANLREANLRGANLRGANLWGADLRGANLDYSGGFPLSCQGSNFTCSLKFVYQILAHLCTLKVDESEQAEFTEILEKIRPYAVKSHRAGDLGLLETKGKKGGQE